MRCSSGGSSWTRSVIARDALIERFLPLARKLARRYCGLPRALRRPRPGGQPRPRQGRRTIRSGRAGSRSPHSRCRRSSGSSSATSVTPSWALHVDRGAQERARRITEARREISSCQGRSPTVPELALLPGVHRGGRARGPADRRGLRHRLARRAASGQWRRRRNRASDRVARRRGRADSSASTIRRRSSPPPST